MQALCVLFKQTIHFNVNLSYMFEIVLKSSLVDHIHVASKWAYKKHYMISLNIFASQLCTTFLLPCFPPALKLPWCFCLSRSRRKMMKMMWPSSDDVAPSRWCEHAKQAYILVCSKEANLAFPVVTQTKGGRKLSGIYWWNLINVGWSF